MITRRLANVLRVRLVGSPEQRLARLQNAEHLNRDKALELLRRTDRGRAGYVREFLHEDVANELLYDLIINTDHLFEGQVARLIGEVVLDCVRPAQRELKQAA